MLNLSGSAGFQKTGPPRPPIERVSTLYGESSAKLMTRASPTGQIVSSLSV